MRGPENLASHVPKCGLCENLKSSAQIHFTQLHHFSFTRYLEPSTVGVAGNIIFSMLLPATRTQVHKHWQRYVRHDNNLRPSNPRAGRGHTDISGARPLPHTTSSSRPCGTRPEATEEKGKRPKKASHVQSYHRHATHACRPHVADETPAFMQI